MPRSVGFPPSCHLTHLSQRTLSFPSQSNRRIFAELQRNSSRSFLDPQQSLVRQGLCPTPPPRLNSLDPWLLATHRFCLSLRGSSEECVGGCQLDPDSRRGCCSAQCGGHSERGPEGGDPLPFAANPPQSFPANPLSPSAHQHSLFGYHFPSCRTPSTSISPA